MAINVQKTSSGNKNTNFVCHSKLPKHICTTSVPVGKPSRVQTFSHLHHSIALLCLLQGAHLGQSQHDTFLFTEQFLLV